VCSEFFRVFRGQHEARIPEDVERYRPDVGRLASVRLSARVGAIYDLGSGEVRWLGPHPEQAQSTPDDTAGPNSKPAPRRPVFAESTFSPGPETGSLGRRHPSRPGAERIEEIRIHPMAGWVAPGYGVPCMKTEEVAKRLVTLCREGQWEAAQKELYATDAVSIEPHATPMFEKETRGLPAIIAKGKKFNGMVETRHGQKISEPVVANNSFACMMQLDVTMKGQGRMNMAELCVYDVKDGKIVSEQFHL
jgi:hypothetical protein